MYSSKSLPISTRFRARPWAGVVCTAWMGAALAMGWGTTCGWAHGDLELRLADLTRQIQGASTKVAELYLQRAELEREHGMWDAAGKDYDAASKAHPGLGGVDRCRAQMLAESGQGEAARALYDKVLAGDPKDGEARVGRGRVLKDLGRLEEALVDYREGLALIAAPDPDWILELADVARMLGRIDEGLKGIDAGLKKTGPLLKLEGCAMDLELERGNLGGALVRVDRIIPLAMRKESWFFKRGELLQRLNRAGEARVAYEASMAELKKLPPRLQESPGMVTLRSNLVVRMTN